MNTGYIKYSDERNKKYSIKTKIFNKDGNKVVTKEAIFEEGKVHLEKIYNAQALLKKYYSNVSVAKAELDNNKLVFEYIEGELLKEKYIAAIENKSEKEFEEILDYHKSLIVGNEENLCDFVADEEFEKIFKNKDSYIGTKGLRVSNFDATAGNIVLKDEKPYFIDYEWVIDFIMPLDLVLFHCIMDEYLHNNEFEAFYPIEKAIKYLGIGIEKSILDKSYSEFYNDVISDLEKGSYAKDKYICLKRADTIAYIRAEWLNCANSWMAAVKSNEELEKELENSNTEWLKCAEEWKKAVNANEELFDQINQKNEEIARIQNEYDTLKTQYDNIVNKKIFKIAKKIKKVFR